eukprot:gene9890-30787_t
MKLDAASKGEMRYGGRSLSNRVSSDYTVTDQIYQPILGNRLATGPSITTGPRFVWPDVSNMLVVGVEGAGHHMLESMGAHLRNCSRTFSNKGHPGIVLDGNEPRQDPVDYERHFRSYFEKDLANNCKSKSDRTAAGTNQDKLVGMMQDSFPQGPHHPLRFPDLYAIANMPTVSSTFVFLRRNLAMATLSSWRRFRSRSNFVDELYFTEAEAMLIEAYYTAICASDTPPPGLRACVVVDFEAICNGDAKTLAALAVGFRVTIEQMQAVYQLKVAGPNPHNYTAGQLAVAKQFFKGRTSALYSHAGNAL